MSGLSAYIPCRCYRNGQSKPFPFPELEQHFRFDNELALWLLDIPDDGANDNIQDQVDEWLNDACVHEDMYYYSRDLTKWYGLRRFEWLLKQIGTEHCPVFLEEMKHINKIQSTASVQASQMLQELSYIEQQNSIGRAPVLVNTVTGDVVLDTIGPITLHYGYHKGNRLNGHQIRLSIDEEGFQLKDYWTQQSIFRSMAFEIYLVDDHTEYRALDSQQTFIHYSDPRFSSVFLESDTNRQISPKIPLHVDIKPVLTAWFREIIDAFKEVLQVSVEIDTPVYWRD